MRNAKVYALAAIYILAAITLVGVCFRKDCELGDAGDRVVKDITQRSGLVWLSSDYTRGKEASSSPAWYTREAHEQESEGLKDTSKISGQTKKVDFTAKRVKEQGNENKNYVVMISADWCIWCKKMYPAMLKLREQGYIIYIFEVTDKEFKGYGRKYKVSAFPTFIVYDKGKEVKRSAGATSEKWFKKHLKPKKDQEETKKPSNIYDGI